MRTVGIVVIDINSGIAFDWVLILTLLVADTHGDVVAVGAVEWWASTLPSNATAATLYRKISLTVESGKLWFILNKIILAVLEDGSLIIEASERCHSLAFRLGILVGILHFLVSLFHVAGTNWLYLLVKRTAQYILHVFNIQSCSTATLTMWWMPLAIIVGYKTTNEILIELLVMLWVVITRTLIIILLLEFLVG